MTPRCLLILLLVASSLAFGQDPVQPPPRGNEPLVIPKVSKEQIICFALYTVHRGVLKLTAQLYPLEASDPRKVRLEVKQGESWKQIVETDVISRGWTAPFRVEKWDASRDVPYRVRHGQSAVYEGLIRRDPIDKETIVVAAFTGNSNADRGPKPDILENIRAHDVDLLFFSGDQVYDHGKHYAAWLLFGRQFGDIIRDRPTITVPDDHDVGQGNLWGAGGKKSSVAAGDDGGYVMDADFVKEVERAQTSHLPDPYDPTPIGQGIGVYYTALTWGGVSFAIIEDRKWKSGPRGLVPQMGPRPDHVDDPTFDPRKVDLPGAELLGGRQLEFLEEWATDWSGAEMKAVLSQTIFANAAHIHGNVGGRLVADLDSNGWPQTGRNKALAAIRKSFSLMIGGDQHLAAVIHHGIDEWGDAGYSFCVPSIWNYYNRWWWPLVPGKNPRQDTSLEMTGEHLDGLGNKVTMLAYANPAPANNRAAGHGIIRFHKRTREMTLECWPRFADVTDPKARQFEGWPIKIRQEGNYARKAAAYLPTLQVKGAADAAVQVFEEPSGELVYALRIHGTRFRPPVFKEGTYTIKVGETDRLRVLSGVRSVGPTANETLEVTIRR
jgi:hypothetical protein